MNSTPNTYPAPIDQLPAFMQELTYAVADQLGVDTGLALSTLTSAMATAVHGSKSVAHPGGGTEPLSLISVIIAAPTTGKTRTYRLTHRVHLDEDLRRYGDILESQEIDSRNQSRSIGGNHGRTRWVSLQNVTNRALVDAIQGIGESTSISSDEGQMILGSDLFRRHLETLNTLFDGNKVMLGRARGNSAMAADASLVSLVMVQPDIFSAYCRKYGEYARGVGFFARALFTIVPPSRPSPTSAASGSCEHLNDYEVMVSKLLRDNLDRKGKGANVREILQFSPEAINHYFALAREHAQHTKSYYWHIEDAANRALQNVVRLAAIMHTFSGETGPIPLQTLEGAYEMVRWHLAQFAVVFPPKPWPVPPPPKLTPQERAQQRLSQRIHDDRQAILGIIFELCMSQKTASALKSDVQTLFREHAYDARFRAALLRLKNEGSVFEREVGKDMHLSIAPDRPSPLPAPTWPGAQSYL